MDYQDAIKIITNFRKSRHWEKYHNLKDLALSANLEASEVLEIFQWKDEKHALGMDPYEEIAKKMKINEHRHWDQDEE